jgi:succinyl-CoA synthetase beta subunit
VYWLEHDAKELLAPFGLRAPAGCLVASAAEAASAALPPGPWIVKAQIAAGGRGRAGLVESAATPEEARARAAAMLGRPARGRIVRAVRIEQAIAGAREAYLGLLLEPAEGAVRAIASERGGMDVEQAPREGVRSALAAADPAALARSVEALAGGSPFPFAPAVREAGALLARAFVELEALLLEVNPLFVFDDGGWIAGDAKLVTDDNALGRQPQLRAQLEARVADYPETALKLAHGFDYVVVDPEGEIALLTTGAGLSMMLIDELRAAGLKPYNFLDIRTGALRGEPARLVRALEWMSAGARVRVLLVNIFAGITDLGEFAQLLVLALRQVPQLAVPVVARLVGNGLARACEVLGSAGIRVHTDLDAALAEVRTRLGA